MAGKARRGQCFPLESPAQLFVAREAMVEHLDRDRTTQLAVFRDVDAAHAPVPDAAGVCITVGKDAFLSGHNLRS
jgi:hypothetical protein